MQACVPAPPRCSHSTHYKAFGGPEKQLAASAAVQMCGKVERGMHLKPGWQGAPSSPQPTPHALPTAPTTHPPPPPPNTLSPTPLPTSPTTLPSVSLSEGITKMSAEA